MIFDWIYWIIIAWYCITCIQGTHDIIMFLSLYVFHFICSITIFSRIIRSVQIEKLMIKTRPGPQTPILDSWCGISLRKMWFNTTHKSGILFLSYMSSTTILKKDAKRKINYLLLEYQTHNLEITIKCRLYTNLLAWNVHKSTYRYYLISCQYFIDSQIKIYWNTVCYALSNRVLSTMPFALLILKILTKIGAIRIIFREIFSARGILICKCDRHVRSHADLPSNQGFLLVERRETLCARVA